MLVALFLQILTTCNNFTFSEFQATIFILVDSIGLEKVRFFKNVILMSRMPSINDWKWRRKKNVTKRRFYVQKMSSIHNFTV